jgi:hypothetical protein
MAALRGGRGAHHSGDGCAVAEHGGPVFVLQQAARDAGRRPVARRNAAHLIERDMALRKLSARAAAAAPHAPAPGMCNSAWRNVSVRAGITSKEALGLQLRRRNLQPRMQRRDESTACAPPKALRSNVQSISWADELFSQNTPAFLVSTTQVPSAAMLLLPLQCNPAPSHMDTAQWLREAEARSVV